MKPSHAVRFSTPRTIAGTLAAILGTICASAARRHQSTQANVPVEITFKAARPHADPFKGVDVEVVFTDRTGRAKTVPAFWAGADKWKVRFASPVAGLERYHSVCNDKDDPGLSGIQGQIQIAPYTGQNPLYRHGPIQVAGDHRHFAYGDGTPFFWLGDTWWKGLCKRITLRGFERLAADRAAKGFTVVQLVAGPYPDEPPFDPRWANEAGMPYTKDFASVNPKYFDNADRRIEHLVQAGIVPALVGGWGWHMASVGVEKMERHWRYLIARYGAYPVVWIVGGEAGGPKWTETAKYIRSADPYHRLITTHSYSSGRETLTDDTVLDFDMLQTGHGGGWSVPIIGGYERTAANTVAKVTSHYSKTPPMPVLVGEVTYEGHMMSQGAEVQRFMFWSSMLNGAAGHTYGAGGIWQMNSRTERGAEYEFTPWFEAMNLPGSTEVGLGKKLLQEYSWWQFRPHPEWVEPHSTTLFKPHANWYDDGKAFTAAGGRWDLPYAAGIPGEVRFIYVPGHYYTWSAPTVAHLERDVPYHAFLFDPASGKRYGLGTIINAGPPRRPSEGHRQPLTFSNSFDRGGDSAWPAEKELPLVMHDNPGIVPAVEVPAITALPGGEYQLPRLPAPQDWVLVLERIHRQAPRRPGA